MNQYEFDLSPKVKKQLEGLSRKEGYALIGSPYNPTITGLKDSLLGEVEYFIDLDDVSIKQIKKKGVIQTFKRIFIQLPLREGIKKRFLDRKLKYVLSELSKNNIPIIPIYTTIKNENSPITYTIKTGSEIDTKKFLSRSNHKTLGMYMNAQFKALRINFELGQLKGTLSSQDMVPLLAPLNSQNLIDELNRLPHDNLVYEKHHYQVFICRSENIPQILREIGRVRELTFREVQEGTGRSFDLDNFDLHYQQLFIWDKNENQIVGGYRLGIGQEIMPYMGIDGLYISKLFKIKKSLYPLLSESLEMGRSFVLAQYQKQRLPLFLLWRGVLELITRYPSIKYLYGPVSISKSYSNISKNLIIEFIRANYYDPKLAKLLKPRRPYKFDSNKKEYKAILKSLNGQLTELDEFIENIEPDHIRIPVLIKQYIKQNARFIGFNLDPNFSDALDGFVILNLKELPETTMDLLMNN